MGRATISIGGKIMWEKPTYEIIETCCEVGAYVYTDEMKKKLSYESDENIASGDETMVQPN
jgi:hypothetical protein